MPKTMILYFSRAGENYVRGSIVNLAEGNTAVAARFAAEASGADLFRIEPERAYPARYRECTELAQGELSAGARPALRNPVPDLSAYSRVVVAGPVWWGTYPMAVLTALEGQDWSGKTVHALVTHEGSGFGNTERALREHCKGAAVGEGLAVQGADCASSRERIAAWARRAGL